MKKALSREKKNKEIICFKGSMAVMKRIATVIKTHLQATREPKKGIREVFKLPERI